MFRKLFGMFVSVILMATFVYPADKVEAAAGAGFYNNNDPQVLYSGGWTYQNTSGYLNAMGGDVHLTSSFGSFVEFTFRGRTITYWYTMAYNRGNFQVFLDGNLVETIFAYTPIVARQNSRTLRVTNPSIDHKIKIVFASSSSGLYLDVDAFSVDVQTYYLLVAVMIMKVVYLWNHNP